MIENIDEILSELEYRVKEGVIDLKKENHVNELINILEDNGVSHAKEIAQKVRVYFSYLDEADTNQPKKMGLIHLGYGYYGKKKGEEATHKSDDGKIRPLTAAEKAERKAKSSKETQKKPKQTPKATITTTDAEKKKSAKSNDVKVSSANPKKIKEVTDTIYGSKKNTLMGEKNEADNEVKNNMIKYGYTGYQKATGKKPAPGGAGSAFNEIISCEGAKILEKYPDLSEEELTRVLVSQFCNTPLGKEQSLTAEVNSSLPSDLKNNPCASKALVCARASRTKYEGVKSAAENLKKQKKLSENTKMHSFYGAEDSKSAQINLLQSANKIYAADGTEVIKDDAISFVAAGGGGANPSDTSIFTTDDQGNVVLNFFSDKTSTADIQDNSTLINEINDKFIQIKSLKNSRIINDKQATVAIKMLEEHAKKVNAIEETYSNSTQTISQTLSGLSNKKGTSTDDQLMALNGKKGTKDKTILKNFDEATLTKDKKTKKTIVRPELLPYLPKGANPAKPTQKDLLIAVREICAKEGGSPAQQKLVNKISKILNDEYINAGITPPDGIDINNIIGAQRKKVVESHHTLFRNLDQTKVNVGGTKMGMGTYLQSQDVIKSFHLKMMDAPPKKYEPGNPESLVYSCFNVNMGGTVVNGQVMRECMGAQNTEDFSKNFSVQETKELTYEYSEKDAREQLALKGIVKPTAKQLENARNVTGMKIFTYAVNKKDKTKIDIGYRTYRAKTGKTGRTNTTMQYSPQMQACFKSKSKKK